MKVEIITFKNLHHEEHFQFHIIFLNLVRKYTAEALKIMVPFEELYLPGFQMEDECLKLVFKSSFTQRLAAMDSARGHASRGLVLVIKAYSHHSRPDVMQAASRLQILIDAYGKISEKSYDKETAAVYNLVKDLRGEYSMDAGKISGLEYWIDELDLCNQQFERLQKERHLELMARTDLRMKTVRKELDSIYRTLTERINALMVVEGEAAYLPFVDELNEHIKHYKYLISQRKGRAQARKNRENNDSITNDEL